MEGGDGPADPPLTTEGRSEAEAVGRWLARRPVDHVVSSPMRRALETAEPLARRLGLEAEVLDGVGEFDARDESYIPFEELRATRDPRWIAMVEGRLDHVGTWVDPDTFRRVVVEAMESLITRFAGRRVAVFTHGGVLNAYLGHVLGVERLLWFYPAYASVSRVAAARSGERSVVSVNETAHLELERPEEDGQ